MLAELFALTLLAQVVETIEVRVTNIDVVVTDRAGKPVTGLTKDDFELYENGKKQAITNFYAVESENRRRDAAVPAGETPALQVPAEVQRRRIIFFIDEDSLDPIQRNKLIRVLDAEIARLIRDGDEGSIVVWNRRAISIEPFTRDSAALRTSLRGLQKRTSNLSNIAGREHVRAQVTSLAEDAKRWPPRARPNYEQSRSIVATWSEEVMKQQSRLLSGLTTTLARLAGVDGKKVVVFATGSLTMHTGGDLFLFVDQLFRGITPVRDLVQFDAAARSLQPQVEKLAKQAASNGVTMYMIDASGTSREAAVGYEEAQIELQKKWNTALALQSIAEMTGGVALTATDNFHHVVGTIADDLDAWYSLGYKSRENDASRRRIEVKVLRPGLRVRSRRSWAPKTFAEQTQDRVIAAVFHEDVRGDMPVRIALRGTPQRRNRGFFTVPVRVTIPSTITLLPDGGELAGGFSVYVVVGSITGDLSNVSKNDRPIRIKPAEEKALRAQPFAYDFDLVVRGGQQTLSVAVVDQLTNQTGFARLKLGGSE